MTAINSTTRVTLMNMTEQPFAATPKRVGRTTNIVNVRLREPGFIWLDKTAEKHGVNRSEIIKAALALAAQDEKKFSALIAARQ